ncbi:hypothetical protein [Actinoplanes sp. URMC 104]|uniref:hypothetical protein n=1 Tax=Actinoplanes sp. URMC 104 TaxID=3423409 RepID=UPI003F1C3E8C
MPRSPGPAHEGRRLPRPDEEVVDQGLGFDLGTLVSRRHLLRGFGLANGGRPFAGTAVYVWHCDRAGQYSLYSEAVKDQNYLRGVQIADAAGKATFFYATTGYEASVSALSRVSLDSDNVFGDDSAATQLGTVTGDPAKGYAVSLTVRVDTSTTPTGGQLSGDGGPSGAPGGPGGTPPSGAPPARVP